MGNEIIWIAYAIVINLIGWASMLSDKRKAKRRKRRIPERTLFIVAALGGALGSLIGMYSARHKTKHRSFVIGMPILLLLNAVCFVYLRQLC